MRGTKEKEAKPPLDVETKETLDELERGPRRRERRQSLPTEPEESQDTGGASGSRQPYQSIPRTDEPTLREMTSAPSRPLDTALVQELVNWCGEIPCGHTKFLNIHRDSGEDAVMGPPELLSEFNHVGTLITAMSWFSPKS